MMEPTVSNGDTATIKERLGRVEGAVHDLGSKVDGLATQVAGLQQAEDRRFADRLLPERVRSLEDRVLETHIYLKQAKWAVVVAGGALLAGIANFMLNLFIAAGS